jgi:hypothetical protein
MSKYPCVFLWSLIPLIGLYNRFKVKIVKKNLMLLFETTISFIIASVATFIFTLQRYMRSSYWKDWASEYIMNEDS